MDYLIPFKKKPTLFALVGVNLLCAPLALRADPLEVRLSATHEYSDNVTKTKEKKDDTLTKVGINLGQTLSKGAYASSLSADFGFEHYWGDTFGDEVTTEVTYSGKYNFSPALSWSLKDELTEDVLNSSTPTTPDSRVRKNVLTTGPSYRVAMTSEDDLVLGANYKQIDFESNTAVDSKRQSATADYMHRFASALTFTWSNSGEWAKLDNETDLETLESELRFSKKYNDLTTSLGVGFTKLKSERANVTNESEDVTGSFNANYQASAALGLFYSYKRTLTDSASETVFQLFERPISFGSSDSVLLQEHVAGASYTPNVRDTFQLTGVSSTEENEGASTKDKEHSLSISWSHNVNSTWSWFASSEYTNKEVGVRNADEDSYDHTLRLNHKWFKNFSSRYYAEYEVKDSSDGANEYDALTVGIGVDYVPNF
ncbi:hypothetical protein HCH_02718 [Hahella chejuensis KCTC 2396]|uniref:Uncharacterized protein n=1 Tax=Hahella chejuensis (strain KCTC 2396) TaxID=349521 RepID=Q2SIM0_HAHCH|nr:hypothetical protein [Hahella chejuensis]ABC29504.1 hypothetical protein HCH_02718 [Hahella chejuensis KCTC 2396]